MNRYWSLCCFVCCHCCRRRNRIRFISCLFTTSFGRRLPLPFALRSDLLMHKRPRRRAFVLLLLLLLQYYERIRNKGKKTKTIRFVPVVEYNYNCTTEAMQIRGDCTALHRTRPNNNKCARLDSFHLFLTLPLQTASGTDRPTDRLLRRLCSEGREESRKERQ